VTSGLVVAPAVDLVLVALLSGGGLGVRLLAGLVLDGPLDTLANLLGRQGRADFPAMGGRSASRRKEKGRYLIDSDPVALAPSAAGPGREDSRKGRLVRLSFEGSCCQRTF